VQEQLRTQNEDLLRKIDGIGQSIATAVIPDQLLPYRKWLQGLLNSLAEQVGRNLKNLNIPGIDILPEVLDQTSVVTRELLVLNDRYLGPLLRARATDRLPLKLLTWMHAENSRTCDLPVVFADGSFGSWPLEMQPTLYLIPPVDQERLLQLPLCFHEYGHLLYACHLSEMDDLVEALQKSIARTMEPLARRNDNQGRSDQRKRKLIAERWYDWTQEFFCDAVGLVMAGPAFAYSFSFYFRTVGQDMYQKSFIDQMRSDHPVTWLRVRLLADRARTLGWPSVADEIEHDWQNIAALLGLAEDYFGCFDEKFLPTLNQTIDDMLVETNPREAKPAEIAFDGPIDDSVTPPALLNAAWRRLQADSTSYSLWESKAISAWLSQRVSIVSS
jgi:hypothetical protein